MSMASPSSNPFVWDRPFAFLWLTADEGHPTQHTLAQYVEQLVSYSSALHSKNGHAGSDSSSAPSPPFMPHVTLHTTKLDPSNLFSSLEAAVRQTAELSGVLGASVSQLVVQLSPPKIGITHFKSVYLEAVEGDANSKMLHRLKTEAVRLFGPNVPSEEAYLPHLSLWYGTNDALRKASYDLARSESVVGSGLDYSLSHLHLVYAPDLDVRSWKIVGSSRLGSDVFFRRTGFIDGKFECVRNADNAPMSRVLEKLPIVNPSNGDNLGYFEGCEKEETERAIQAAHRALHWWSVETTLAQRVEILHRLIALIRSRAWYLAKMETLDNGKPLREAHADISDAADCFEYYVTLAESDKRLNGAGSGHVHLPEAMQSQVECHVEYAAVGVCAMILPFNYPLLMAAWKLAPSLICGCTVVVKPSEMTSASALELAAMAQEAGLPSGVLNVLPGLGPAVGPTLISSPLVRKIAFTGSGHTGKHILRESTKHLPNTTLELGGKSPAIVFEDANLDSALDWLLMGIFFNAGQVCSATSRLIVHESIYERVKEMLTAACVKLAKRTGDGMDQHTLMGPLVSLTQYNRVRHLVEQGMAQGARLVTGSRNFDPDTVKHAGFYFYPTILENVTDQNILWTTEVFGPVLVMRSFEQEQDAIKMANDTAFGLAAAVFTQDKHKQARVSKRLDAGVVWINCSQPTIIQAPWGGMKESGVGRELGPWGLENFLEPKQVTSWISKDNYGWYGSL